jgi:hypothetical protein
MVRQVSFQCLEENYLESKMAVGTGMKMDI